MPRQQFSDLEDVFETFVEGGFDINQLSATNKYRKYYEWKTDPALRELGDRPATSRPGRMISVFYKPFGVAYDADTGYKEKASRRAVERVIGVAPIGTYVSRTEPTTVRTNNSIQPAKATLGVRTSGTSERSRITGQRYRRRVNATYTIPFGRATASDTEFAVQDAILANDTLASTYVVTFTPERRYLY